MDALIAPVRDFLGPAWLPIWTLVKIVALVVPRLMPVVPIQLALAIPAAWAGARVARKQASLRRQIAHEREA